MRLIRKKQQEQGMNYIMGILDIIETIPTDALGNSADSLDKLSKLYYATAELAYIINGVKGLNQGIAFFNKRARTIDEIMAISKAHLKVVANHTEGDKN